MKNTKNNKKNNNKTNNEIEFLEEPEEVIKEKKTIKKKTFKKKNYIIILVALIVIVLIVIVNNKKTPNDGLTYNKNKSFTKEQKVSGITFKNIKCTYNGKDSIISYTMVNETNKTIHLNNYDIIVKDKNKERLTKIVASITQTIEPKKEVTLSNEVIGVDLSNAYYLELKVNTEKENK